MGKQNITVTQPFLPPLEEFMPYLQKIWQKKWLTNNGEFHRELEAELANYLGVPYVSLFANGTLALVTALQALNITGEVITTPYTFVATAHSLIWNNITPVFVDIDPVTGNIDPTKIEKAITENTTAVLPVHVYGNPCDTLQIEKIANRYNLKVIYDAAHAFGITVNGESILNSGDLSILSFHATKVFNTFEGGAVICKDAATKQHIDDLKNFGFRDEVTVVEAGINGKMNEFQAALGLLQLKYIDNQIEKRKDITVLYRDLLKNKKGIRFIDDIKKVKHNYSYFPVFIDDNYGISRDELYNRFRDKDILVRRYFYPLISNMPMYKYLPSAKKENLPVANKLAGEVICLPIYPELTDKDIKYICNLI
jgi:dTDP-4-amino-4,6-dideoxygalactose transaminase